MPRNRLLALDAEDRRGGVVAASAGNHAQGVAYHARALGVPATIVVPERTPFTKIARSTPTRCEGAGARREHGGSTRVARDLADDDGLVFVHPYDDPLVIAGQGTVGREILAAVPDIDAIVVPVGGGGLLAGVAVAVRAEAPRARGGRRAERAVPRARAPVPLRGRRPLCRGDHDRGRDRVSEPGTITGEILDALVDDVVTVREATIEEAMTYHLELEKTVVEGAGAAPLAQMLEDRARFARPARSRWSCRAGMWSHGCSHR